MTKKIKSELNSNNSNISPLELYQRLSSSPEDEKDNARIDYSQFRESQGEPWKHFWDIALSPSKNFSNLIKDVAIIPNEKIQIPIITAYAFIPSALAHIIPILFLQGSKGSGKSIIATLIAALHNQEHEIKSAATTFAALRNHLSKIRWYDKEQIEEKNSILVWDDISEDTLKNPNIYAMLKSGYNRKTEIIEIAGNEPGSNMQFNTFSSKVVSSIKPFYADSRFNELSRRCIVIKCKRWEDFKLSEKSEINRQDFDIRDKLDLEDINWEGFTVYADFWRDVDNIKLYINNRKKLSSRKKSFKIPDVINSERWTISIDLITTGISTGVWDSISDALDCLEAYWIFHKLNIADSVGALHKILKDFVDSKMEMIDHASAEGINLGIPREVNTESLKKIVLLASSKGELDIQPSPINIAQVMLDIGWKLDKNCVGKIVWMPV